MVVERGLNDDIRGQGTKTGTGTLSDKLPVFKEGSVIRTWKRYVETIRRIGLHLV